MKKLLFFAALWMGLATTATSQGINFDATTWEEAVEKAQAENKLIFIDAHTTWCAPCKVMDEYVFTHEMAGDQYNSNFINLKMDMEKDMGPLFGLRYDVSTYPTFLFLTWDGTLVYKSVGYQNIEKFAREGRTALEPYRLERALNDRFNEGDRIPDFLYSYLEYKKSKNDATYADIVPLYLEAEKEWNQPRTLQLIFDHVSSFDSDHFMHMAKNKVDYALVVGETPFNEKFNGFIQSALHNDGKPISLARREEIYQVAYPHVADRMMTEFKLDYYKDAHDEPNYAKTAYYYYTTYAEDDDEGIASDIDIIEKHVNNKEARAFVRAYHEKSIAAINTPAAWLKLARYQLADASFDMAKEYGKRAKKLAKTQKEDQSPYKAFLKEVKMAAKK